MRLSVIVSGVDGETNVSLVASRVRVAKDFLAKHDHEGSSIGLQISVDEPDIVYRLLDALELYVDGASR